MDVCTGPLSPAPRVVPPQHCQLRFQARHPPPGNESDALRHSTSQRILCLHTADGGYISPTWTQTKRHRSPRQHADTCTPASTDFIAHTMSVIVREVSQLSENETKEYTKLLAEAFEYRFFGDGFGDDKSLQEPIIEAQLNAAQIDGQGEIHVAEIPGVGAVGVAIWFGPGRAFLSTDAQRNAGWMRIMEGLPVKYQLWWLEFSKEYEAVSDKYLGPGVKLGAYYLQLIGVAPDHQKKGVARALLQYGEAKVSAQR
ncbi:hypothetical protein BD413DRAFT_230906 [Trametes elegans]|nr:hypothetical protein BD413DRAFT_230906 [Trametes elegans]